MRLYFLLAVFISGNFSLEKPEPFDFVEDALEKFLNHSVDPCDNFYRHACSFDSPHDIITSAFEEMTAYLDEVQKNNFYNKLSVTNDYDLNSFEERAANLSNLQFNIDFFTDIFNSSCVQNIEFSAELIKMLVDITQHVFRHSNGAVESRIQMIRNNGEEERCQKLSNIVRESLKTSLGRMTLPTAESVNAFRAYTTFLVKSLKTISAHIDVDVREGIHETRQMVLSIINFAENQIESTPWLRNQTVRAEFEKIVKQMNMYDNFGLDFKNYTDQLFDMENKYTTCKSQMKNIINGDLLCYIWTASVSQFTGENGHFLISDNAWNEHPSVFFGFPNYYHTTFAKEVASKLGYTGFTAGHEIGHSYFDDNRGKPHLPVFPKKLGECVQKQYRATCDEFKEESCSIDETQLDDNGAGIFGLHAAYVLLEQHFGEEIENTIDRLDITNEQLFFYSFAFQFCGGAPSTDLRGEWHDWHAARNIRVNAIAQHPGFQNAFNCPDDSRMMKSATERCILYGEGAPESRKQRKLQNKI